MQAKLLTVIRAVGEFPFCFRNVFTPTRHKKRADERLPGKSSNRACISGKERKTMKDPNTTKHTHMPTGKPRFFTMQPN